MRKEINIEYWLYRYDETLSLALESSSASPPYQAWSQLEDTQKA